MKTVISGSYRKHLREISELKQRIEDNGTTVLAPLGAEVSNPGEEFALLKEDISSDPHTVQDSIFAMIRSLNFLTVANIDGYIGTATTFEMGYAVAHGLQVLTLEPVLDPNLARYTRLLAEVLPSTTAASSPTQPSARG